MTSHDEEFIEMFAERVVVLAGGEVVEMGAPGQVLHHPRHPETRRLLKSPSAAS